MSKIPLQCEQNSDILASPRQNTQMFPLILQRSTVRYYGSAPLVQAVRVKIERVCVLLEEITIFFPDDQ